MNYIKVEVTTVRDKERCTMFYWLTEIEKSVNGNSFCSLTTTPKKEMAKKFSSEDTVHIKKMLRASKRKYKVVKES